MVQGVHSEVKIHSVLYPTMALDAKVIAVQLAKQCEQKDIKFVYHGACLSDLKKYTSFFDQHDTKLTVTPLSGSFEDPVSIDQNKCRVVYCTGDEHT